MTFPWAASASSADAGGVAEAASGNLTGFKGVEVELLRRKDIVPTTRPLADDPVQPDCRDDKGNGCNDA